MFSKVKKSSVAKGGLVDIRSTVDKITEYQKSRPIVHFQGAKENSPLTVETDNKARFVRFSLQVLSSFHLDTIEIFNKAGRNIAPNKSTIISSFFNDEVKYSGAGVLVGKKNGGCGFHTKKERNPWIIIDLGSIRNLDKVIVYNREGEFYSRALSLMIETSKDLKHWELIFDNWSCIKVGDDVFSEDEKALLYANILESEPVRKRIAYYKSIDDYDQANNLYLCANELVKDRGLALAPQHGFTKPFALRSGDKKQTTLDELSLLLKYINEEFGVPAFISSGTLLGMVRDGDFIGHDDDVDICYISNKCTEDEILKERLSLVEFLTSKGCNVRASDVAHYWCTTPNGISLDIFTGFIEEDYCSMNPIGRREVLVENVLPLEVKSFNGRELYLPRNPEPLLILNYGPNWKVPDPLWSFNWGQAKQNFSFLYFK
jgi:hypothetical protein